MTALQKAMTEAETMPELSIGSSGGDTHPIDRAERVARTERLIEEFHEPVYRYAFWLTGCRPTAEDITQEVFTRAFRSIHNLRETKAAKSWLMTITRNESTRVGRKPRPISVAEIAECVEPADEKSESLAENCEWVSQGLAELSEEYRTVVLMFYYEQLSYSEIADKLAIPIGTVMSRLNRGRSHLRKTLDRLAEPRTLVESAESNPQTKSTWNRIESGTEAVEHTETPHG